MIKDFDDLVDRLREADVREPMRASEQYRTLLGDHAADEIVRLRAEVDILRDKALRYDLDQAGIERRNAEAVELVELRAEVAEADGVIAVWRRRTQETEAEANRLKAECDAIERRTIERCAGVCDDIAKKWEDLTGHECAAAIRALLEGK